jgi:hypothetical protein
LQTYKTGGGTGISAWGGNWRPQTEETAGPRIDESQLTAIWFIPTKTRSKEDLMTLRKLVTLLAVALMVLSLGGCFTLDAPVDATSNPVGEKVGESSGSLILGIGNVDSSIRQAAANGGISEISTVDFEIRNILGVYQKFTTTVTGE